VDKAGYLTSDNYVHPSPFLRNHTCVDTLNTYINLKEGLALLGLFSRYTQCSYERRKKKRAEPWRLCSIVLVGWGRFSSSRAFQTLRLTVSVVVAAAAAVVVVVIAAAAAVAAAVAVVVFVALCGASSRFRLLLLVSRLSCLPPPLPHLAHLLLLASRASSSLRPSPLGLTPSSSGSTPSSSGSTLRRWGLRPSSLGFTPSPLGFTPFVVGSYPFVVGVYALRRWVLPLRRWVLPLRCWVLPLGVVVVVVAEAAAVLFVVVVAAFVVVVVAAVVGVKGNQWGGMKNGRKRTTTFRRGSFRDALDGPPNSWVPPRVSITRSFADLPNSPPPSSGYKPAHIPLERGGAGVAAICSAHPGVLVIEPTSLMRGEGLVAGWLGTVASDCGGELVAKADGGGGGMRPISTVMRLMSV
jgi:hypothetical protein